MAEQLRRYGVCAANPEGWPENERHCIEAIRPVRVSGMLVSDQCARNRGYGPDGLYCRQHGNKAQEKLNRQAKMWTISSAAVRYRERMGEPTRHECQFEDPVKGVCVDEAVWRDQILNHWYCGAHMAILAFRRVIHSDLGVEWISRRLCISLEEPGEISDVDAQDFWRPGHKKEVNHGAET